MDKIVEILVKKENTIANILVKYALWGVAFALAAVSLFAIPHVGAVVCVAVIYAAFKVNQRLDVEYEYVYVNGDMDIDRIFSKTIRKKFISIELNRIVAIGKSHNENIKKLSYNCKVTDATSGSNEEVYAVIYNGAEGRKKLLIDGCEIVDLYKALIPEKVF